MLKIRALNKESSSDEDVPVIRREAQVKNVSQKIDFFLNYINILGRDCFGTL